MVLDYMVVVIIFVIQLAVIIFVIQLVVGKNAYVRIGTPMYSLFLSQNVTF